MYILGIIMLVLGAVTTYLDKKTFKVIYKREPDENESLKIKGIGFVVALIGVILIMVFFK